MLRLHVAKVVAGEQRSSEDGPEAHVGSVLVERHSAVADLEHVWIVPVSGARVAGEPGLREADERHAIVLIGDVAGSAPEVSADLRAPLPNVAHTVLAETENDGPACGGQGLVHLTVRLVLRGKGSR